MSFNSFSLLESPTSIHDYLVSSILFYYFIRSYIVSMIKGFFSELRIPLSRCVAACTQVTEVIPSVRSFEMRMGMGG